MICNCENYMQEKMVIGISSTYVTTSLQEQSWTFTTTQK